MKYIKQILFILIVIAIAILLFIIQERKDYTEYILKLDTAIKDTLVKNNIKDKDIIHQYWREKKQGLQYWVEITKEIEVPEYVQSDKLRKSLVESVKKYNPEIYLGENIEIGKDKKIFIRLIFHKKKLRVALVIDDLGYDEEAIENFLNLNIPINFSVLPKEKFTKKITEKFQKLNIPYLLHLPLEPHNIKKNYPGEAAILLSMTDRQIEEMFEENLKSVGNPVGVNNHMGSKFTEDEEKMAVLLNVIKKHGLFFLDSHTSKKPVSHKVAKKVGVKCLVNNVFLDMVGDDPELIRKQFDILLSVVKRNKKAIAIGHIERKTLPEVIKSIIPYFKEKNIEFVYLKDLLEE